MSQEGVEAFVQDFLVEGFKNMKTLFKISYIEHFRNEISKTLERKRNLFGWKNTILRNDLELKVNNVSSSVAFAITDQDLPKICKEGDKFNYGNILLIDFSSSNNYGDICNIIGK